MRDLKRRKDINERTKIVSGCFLTSLLESTKRGGLKPVQVSIKQPCYVYLPCNWLMGMCRWMRLHFDNNGIAFQ